MELGLESGYLTAYQVIEIKALGLSRTKHVPADEVLAQRRALTFELRPFCVLEEVRESSTPLFGMSGPKASVFKLRDVLAGAEIMADNTFVIVRRFLH